jgi:type VI secretion system protein ImpK
VLFRSAQARRLPVPLWAFAALAAVLALLTFSALSWRLGERSDIVFAAVGGLKLPALRAAPAPSVAPLPAQAPPARLAEFLAPEIREDLVTVRDEVDRSVVVLRGDGLFDAGTATVRDRYLPVLSRVADALNGTRGGILISGYTDDTPIRTARFPSNWHLSQARADAVKDLLQQRLANAARVRAEGRGDANPIASNNSPANRARNRRVEITLLVPPLTPMPPVPQPVQPVQPGPPGVAAPPREGTSQ